MGEGAEEERRLGEGAKKGEGGRKKVKRGGVFCSKRRKLRVASTEEGFADVRALRYRRSVHFSTANQPARRTHAHHPLPLTPNHHWISELTELRI